MARRTATHRGALSSADKAVVPERGPSYQFGAVEKMQGRVVPGPLSK